MREFSPKWYTISEFEKENTKNLHVLARADMEALADVGYELLITADDYYKLYVNGKFVTQGPAPAYPEKYYYNRIDITPYLTTGHNILAVHLYYQGLINRVWNSGDGRFGVGAQIVVKESKVAADMSEGLESMQLMDVSWRYKLPEAYSGETIGYDTQFLEDFDSRRWDDNWAKCDYIEDGYKPMIEDKEAEYSFAEQPTKQLQIYEMRPVKVTTGRHEQTDMTEQERCSGGTECILQYDMGREIVGCLGIRARGSEGDIVHIYCGEELADDGCVRYDMRCNCYYHEQWTLRQGQNLLEQYDYKGFRYIELHFCAGVDIEDIWVQVRHYPFDDDFCRLNCEDKKLNAIFQLCKDTIKYGTQEAYLDCPTREKGQYLGDAIVTAHSHILLTGSVDMLRKTIDQFAMTSGICPGIMAVAPGSLMQGIADFSLLWPKLLLLDYQFTGDVEFLKRYYPVAKNMLEHFAQYEGEDGLLYQVADKWNLVDWPENLRDDYDFNLSRPVVAKGCHNVINALYIGALKMVAHIEEVIGVEQNYKEKLQKCLNSFYRAFWNEGTRLFVDRKEDDLHGECTHSALHSNVYPLYFGLVPEAEVGETDKNIDSIVSFIRGKGLCCGVFISYFLLKGLARVGRKDVVYELLTNDTEHGWMNMLKEGATTCFEAWGKEQKWNTSLCHPWACAPVSLILENFT